MPGILQTPSSALAVFEREAYWAPLLQRQLQGEVALRACTRLSTLEEWLAEWPRGVALVELDAAPAAILTWLGRRLHQPACRPVLVLGSSAMSELEPLVRELGAAAFHPPTVPCRILLRQCRTLLQHQTVMTAPE